jgi:hypothetical protein
VAALAEQLYRLYTEDRSLRLGVLHRICTDLGNGNRPGRRLEQWYELEFADLHEEIRTRFRRTIPVADRDQWEKFILSQKEELAHIEEHISLLESKINQRIFSLYRLSRRQIRMVIEDEDIGVRLRPNNVITTHA